MNEDIIVTKREILLSVAIICVMLLVGFLISDKINDSLMTKQQEYNTALQINGDKEMFEYGMRTNIGNAFVYGDLKAVDTVTYEEIGGKYSYVKKIREEYTRHTREVTKSNGKVTWTETEVYYTWDEKDSESKHSTKITFLGVGFDYGTISFPGSSHITTIKTSSDVRYQYYGAPSECNGTLYTNLNNGTINDSSFYHYDTIEETLEIVTSNASLWLFWIFWIALTAGAVFIFYVLDNDWLEDKLHWRRS